MKTSPIYEKKETLKFTATIRACNRREIIEELKWFITQLELKSDGGGSDNDDLVSSWSIWRC
jgi:hypothetical protein